MDNLIVPVWWSYLLRSVIFYLAAWGVSRLSRRLAGWLVRPIKSKYISSQYTPERQAALQGLIASSISVLVFVLATLLTLGQFIDTNTLIWMIGLFSAAFGLGARPLISDGLTGISFIFEDNFGVGEKIEVNGIEGLVEEVKLRTTQLRGSQGELYIIPNGEITTIRNFSRGHFSRLTVRLKLRTADLDQTITLLGDLGPEVMSHLPDLLEPWEVISEDEGTTGQTTELILVTKAKFGKAAGMRPRLLAFIQTELQGMHIELVD